MSNTAQPTDLNIDLNELNRQRAELGLPAVTLPEVQAFVADGLKQLGEAPVTLHDAADTEKGNAK